MTARSYSSHRQHRVYREATRSSRATERLRQVALAARIAIPDDERAGAITGGSGQIAGLLQNRIVGGPIRRIVVHALEAQRDDVAPRGDCVEHSIEQVAPFAR